MRHLKAIHNLIMILLILCSCAQVEKSKLYTSFMDIKGDAPDSLKPEWKDGNTIDNIYMQSKADYHFTIAESYALEGNIVKAIENYKMTLVYDPNSARVHFRLATEYVKMGLVSEALANAQEAIRLDSKLIDAHLLLGGLYSAMKLYDKAEESYKNILLIDPDHKESKIFLGALLVDQGEYDKAIAYFQKLASKKDEEEGHQPWYFLGRVYFEKGDIKSLNNAASAYRTALQIKTDYVEAVLALGEVYKKLQKPEQEKKAYESYQLNNGADYNVAQRLGQIYLEQSEFAKGYEQFRILEAKDPDNLNVSLKLAFILIEQQKYPDAIKKLEQIVFKAPESDKVRFYLGAVYEEVKDYKSAINHFSQIQFNSVYYDDAIIHKSYLYKLMNDYPAAIETVKKGIFHKDNNPKFYALYASYLDEQGSLTEAKSVLKDAVVKFRDNVQLFFHLGSVSDKLGDREATVKNLERVLELDANHVQALNYLAFVYADSTENLDTAENLARKALNLKPDDGYILDTLGWVLFKKNKVEEAVKMLETAYRTVRDESIIAEHLGDAYFKYKLPQRAKQMYKIATSLSKDLEGKKKLEQKITAIEIKVQAESEVNRNRIPASQK